MSYVAPWYPPHQIKEIFEIIKRARYVCQYLKKPMVYSKTWDKIVTLELKKHSGLEFYGIQWEIEKWDSYLKKMDVKKVNMPVSMKLAVSTLFILNKPYCSKEKMCRIVINGYRMGICKKKTIFELLEGTNSERELLSAILESAKNRKLLNILHSLMDRPIKMKIEHPDLLFYYFMTFGYAGGMKSYMAYLQSPRSP